MYTWQWQLYYCRHDCAANDLRLSSTAPPAQAQRTHAPRREETLLRCIASAVVSVRTEHARQLLLAQQRLQRRVGVGLAQRQRSTSHGRAVALDALALDALAHIRRSGGSTERRADF